MNDDRTFDVLIVMNNVERRVRLATEITKIMKTSPYQAASAMAARVLLAERRIVLVIIGEDLIEITGQEFLAELGRTNPLLKTFLIQNEAQLESGLFPVLRSLKAAKRVYLWLHKIFPRSQKMAV